MSIQNVIASARNRHPFDLDFIEEKFPGLCYRSVTFGSLNLKNDVPTICQLFRNGKIILIGGKTEEGLK